MKKEPGELEMLTKNQLSMLRYYDENGGDEDKAVDAAKAALKKKRFGFIATRTILANTLTGSDA
jgi:hypothetical protein